MNLDPALLARLGSLSVKARIIDMEKTIEMIREELTQTGRKLDARLASPSTKSRSVCNRRTACPRRKSKSKGRSCSGLSAAVSVATVVSMS